MHSKNILLIKIMQFDLETKHSWTILLKSLWGKEIAYIKKQLRLRTLIIGEKYRDLRNKVIAEIMAPRPKLKQPLTWKVFYPQ